MKFSNIFLAASLLFCTTCISQVVPKGFEITEISQVAEAYRLASNISFDMLITYTDSAQPRVILEQVQGKYKMKGGNYWAMIDSIEFVQGTQYSLSVMYDDSTIMVNKPQQYSAVLQIPLLDSFFRQSNISDMRVTKVNDSTRSLVVVFNQQAYYRSYEMQYDLNTFLIRKVKYYVTDSNGDPNSSGVDCVTITFLNYSNSVISNAVFDESKFVYRQGIKLLPQPSFNGFNVIVANNN